MISCPYGISKVGAVMITYGLTLAVCSAVNGRLAKISGLFVVSCVGNLPVYLCISFSFFLYQ